MAAEHALGATTAWVADIDPGPRKILAHRFPHVPNLGDVTRVDWSQVEPVDIIAGGFPCQPVSNAGRQLGDQDERWLWDEIVRAVRVLRPGLVVLENVRGLLTAGRGRLFGRVLGTLAELGYDAQWHGLRAADIGACHGRWRVLVIAYPQGDPWRIEHRDGRTAAYPHDAGRSEMAVQLLPTPGANLGDNGGPQHPDKRRAGGHSVSIEDAVHGLTLNGIAHENRWGDYAAAIHRHERMLGRPAPSPTEPGRNGNPRLSARFVEWMMALPDGWVTDVPGITRAESLRALGNGVLPQQAIAALEWMGAACSTYDGKPETTWRVS